MTGQSSLIKTTDRTAAAGWIAVTQRRIRFPGRGEEGDYLDRRWAPLLAGHRILVVPNDLVAACRALAGLALTGIVLTGGNDLPSAPASPVNDPAPERDTVEGWLLKRAERHRTPVVGICRGAQALAAHAGARLVDGATQHAGTRHQVLTAAPAPWGWPTVFTVDSHHRHVLPVAQFPAVLKVLAWADDGCGSSGAAGGDEPVGTVEAFAHWDLPWWGLMWHPEREEPPGAATRALRHLLHTQLVHPGQATRHDHRP
jgi:putative glutamine amidotransferase